MIHAVITVRLYILVRERYLYCGLEGSLRPEGSLPPTEGCLLHRLTMVPSSIYTE